VVFRPFPQGTADVVFGVHGHTVNFILRDAKFFLAHLCIMHIFLCIKQAQPMTTDSDSPTARPSKTLVTFDLSDELTPEEIAMFEASAKAAGAQDITEHFLNLTLRLPEQVA
jgi:hypothetical protein